jgi:hypothetical protein
MLTASSAKRTDLAVSFWIAIAIAIAARLLLFFGSMIVPIPNELSLPVSPLWANALDIDFYQGARAFYLADPGLVLDFFLQSSSGGNARRFPLPGPVFPLLLHLFDYGPENPLPLSAAYLLVSCLLAAIWIWWLQSKGLSPAGLYLFALFPTPFWFMLNVSTDLLFAAVVGAFWLVWFGSPRNALPRWTSITGIVVLAMLLRPNSLSLSLYLCLDVLIWEFFIERDAIKRRRSLLFAGFLLLLTMFFSGFYMTYFHLVLSNDGKLHYFGVLTDQFSKGIFPALPTVIDHILSWLALLGAKILYLAGLRPSYGEVLTPLFFLRLLPGFIILPGVLTLPFLSNRREQLFLFAFIAPLILGIGQERYLLPIQPILFFYGIIAWTGLFRFLKKPFEK